MEHRLGAQRAPSKLSTGARMRGAAATQNSSTQIFHRKQLVKFIFREWH